MVEGMQPDGHTPEVSWEVSWTSSLTPKDDPAFTASPRVIVRRDEGDAVSLARSQRSAGFEVSLFRIEKTEIDF